MKRIILHIGPHKTGSTYIQKTLYQNRNLLLKNNILYPDEWIVQYGHHEAAELENADAVIEGIKEKISSKGVRNIILSSENFDRWSQNDVESFVKNLNIDLTIVYFYRDPLSKLYSHWQEEVKFGSSSNYSEYLLEQLLDPINSIVLNPSKTLKNWANVLGEENIEIFDYDELLTIKADICRTMLHKLFGTDCGLDFTNDHENKSFDRIDAEILRYINAIDISKGHNPSLDIRVAYINLLENNESIKTLKTKINLKTIERRVSCTICQLEECFTVCGLQKIYLSNLNKNHNDSFLLHDSNWHLGYEDLLEKIHMDCRLIIDDSPRKA